jgi:dTDP-4-amino-4,6-dideoxygalactose transaminase
MIAHLRAEGVQAPFHYVPLHNAPGGERFGRSAGNLSVTETEAAKLVRLPMWYGMGEDRVDSVLGAIRSFFQRDNS